MRKRENVRLFVCFQDRPCGDLFKTIRRSLIRNVIVFVYFLNLPCVDLSAWQGKKRKTNEHSCVFKIFPVLFTVRQGKLDGLIRVILEIYISAEVCIECKWET